MSPVLTVTSHRHSQGSGKWRRWGRIFPDRAKSHGQFGPKTTYKTDGQTERQRDRQTVSEKIDRKALGQIVR